ncbi:MAG: hypothetical protein IJA47_00400 [Oscillospiraceae bacterium]|nr:hypothetical protein [Oscillospiraceae bacterium]
MKDSLRRIAFPWFAILAGVIGLALQSWLLSSAGNRGLLPSPHIATSVCLLLLAATLEVCLLAVLKFPPTGEYAELFPRSPIAAAGTAIAAIGMLISAFSMPATGILKLLTPITGILAGIALLVTAYYRFKGLQPNCLFHSAVAVFFIIRTMACCQSWGSEPQLQTYLFPLLAALLLLIASYYRAELDVMSKSSRWYIFFSQGALMCCLSSGAHSQGLFYLSAALWLASDYFVLIPARQE